MATPDQNQRIHNLSKLDGLTRDKAKKSKLLDVSTLLPKLDAARLRKFVRKEAARSRAMQIRFKAEFILLYDGETAENPFDLLLGEIIKETTRGKPELTKREETLLHEVVGKFLEHGRMLLQNQQFRSVSEILVPCIQQLHKYFDKLEHPEERTTTILIDVYNLLGALLPQRIAPELRAEMFSALMEVIDKSYYKVYHAQVNGIAAASQAAADADDRAAIYTIVKRKVAGENPLPWATQYALCAHNFSRPMDKALLDEYVDDRLALRVARQLRSMSDGGALSGWLATMGRIKQPQGRDGEEWANMNLSQALQLKSVDDVGYHAAQVTLWARNFDSLPPEVLKPPYADKVLQYLSLIKQSDLALKMQELVHELSRLERTLRQAMSLEQLIDNLSALAIYDVTDRPESIFEFIEHYVTHNAGPSCKIGYQQILRRLQELGHNDLAKEVDNRIEDLFPGRFRFSRSELNIS